MLSSVMPKVAESSCWSWREGTQSADNGVPNIARLLSFFPAESEIEKSERGSFSLSEDSIFKLEKEESFFPPLLSSPLLSSTIVINFANNRCLR